MCFSYFNIGGVYDRMGDNSKALSNYEKSLEIRQQSLPSNHPDLGVLYNNIGGLYGQMGDYSKAHSFCKLAVENGQRSLPADHPTLQQRKKNLEDMKKTL
jgi:tetratricopeptide (TPR) repeat protein